MLKRFFSWLNHQWMLNTNWRYRKLYFQFPGLYRHLYPEEPMTEEEVYEQHHG